MLDETVVPGPLLQYKNTSRLARGDDVRRFRALYEQELDEGAAIARFQTFEVEAARTGPPGAVSRAPAFVGCARRVGVSEVKKKGGAHHSSGSVLYPIFLAAPLTPCSVTRGRVSVGMFRDRSDPLTDYLRKASSLSARTAKRFTRSSHGRSK